MRDITLWGVLAFILISVNFQIIDKEKIITHGDAILLELAPRDPRSLLQGDFMALRYKLAADILRRLSHISSTSGRVVIVLDENWVATFRRMDSPGQALAENEKRLFFRKRGRAVRVASDAYFFQEGHGKFYRNAHYGELRVNADGESVLVGLRDHEFKLLIPEK